MQAVLWSVVNVRFQGASMKLAPCMTGVALLHLPQHVRKLIGAATHGGRRVVLTLLANGTVDSK